MWMSPVCHTQLKLGNYFTIATTSLAYTYLVESSYTSVSSNKSKHILSQIVAIIQLLIFYTCFSASLRLTEGSKVASLHVTISRDLPTNLMLPSIFLLANAFCSSSSGVRPSCLSKAGWVNEEIMKGGREGGRERGREGGRERGNEGGREGKD